MLHAPTTENANAERARPKTLSVPELERHPLSCRQSGFPVSAALPHIYSNQAALSRLSHPALSLRPSQSIALQRKCTCGDTPDPSGECAACRAKRLNSSTGRAIQTKLVVGQPGDPYEREADRVAEAISRPQNLAPVVSPGTPFIQRKCAACGGEKERDLTQTGGKGQESSEEELTMLGGRWIQRQTAAGRKMPGLTPEQDVYVSHLGTGGRPLDASTIQFFEGRLGYDFSPVRIHSDTQASQAARSLGARAFTVGSSIVFGEAQYAPGTSEGRRLLAHEMTHVVQQGSAHRLPTPPRSAGPTGAGGGVPSLQCDLATDPPVPAAVAAELTPASIQEAIRFNQFRFKDPFDIATVRDVLGLPKFPAVIDEPFVLAVAQWQAEQGLPQDGKVGANTTRTLLTELRAEGALLPSATAKADTLALDNFVSTTDVTAPTFNTCPNQPSFLWTVNFQTSLRSGFIIQQIDSTFNAVHCDGTPYVGPLPTMPRYWEAWQVDANGNRIPGGSPDDTWQRGFCSAGLVAPCVGKETRGTWSMTGTAFTVRTLPASAHFVVGGAPDAGVLLSTVTAPRADDLGLVSGQRRIGGAWNCCNAVKTHTRT